MRQTFFSFITAACHAHVMDAELQNHMEELWSLFNIACHGNLLGERKDFARRFGSTILQAQDRHATEAQQQVLSSS